MFCYLCGEYIIKHINSKIMRYRCRHHCRFISVKIDKTSEVVMITSNMSRLILTRLQSVSSKKHDVTVKFLIRPGLIIHALRSAKKTNLSYALCTH